MTTISAPTCDLPPGSSGAPPACAGYDLVISQQRGAVPTLTVRCRDCGWQQPASRFELDEPAGRAVTAGVSSWLEHSS